MIIRFAMMNEKKIDRTIYLDMLRLVACLGVIHIHVSDDEFDNAFLSYNWYISIVNESIVHWAVPIFIMISGALFLNPNKEISIKIMWRKYIPRLFKLYIFWIFFLCGGSNYVCKYKKRQFINITQFFSALLSLMVFTITYYYIYDGTFYKKYKF